MQLVKGKKCESPTEFTQIAAGAPYSAGRLIIAPEHA
jgi:hypothetical protein